MNSKGTKFKISVSIKMIYRNNFDEFIQSSNIHKCVGFARNCMDSVCSILVIVSSVYDDMIHDIILGSPDIFLFMEQFASMFSVTSLF